MTRNATEAIAEIAAAALEHGTPDVTPTQRREYAEAGAAVMVAVEMRSRGHLSIVAVCADASSVRAHGFRGAALAAANAALT